MLNGIRIIEIEGLGPGPFAGMLLADLGADVIVVHRKDNSGASPGSATSSILDRGKRSIELDLKNEDDIAVLKGLIADSNALIEGFRPGVMERLGLGPDICHAVNPRLVYGRMTGWGQQGPMSHAAGHDMNYISMSGALWYSSLPGDPPVTPATLVGDIGGGALYLVIGILSGVIGARNSGKGTVVDAAIVDGSAHMMNLLMSLAASNALQAERGRSLLDGPHWSRTYRTKDGGYMSVQALEPKFYALFLDLLGVAGDPQFKRQYDQKLWPELSDRTAAIFMTRTRDEWAAIFEGTDACVAAVRAPQEANEHPHMQARGTWFTGGNDLLQAAPAPRFGTGGSVTPGPIPTRGQHSREIRDSLAAKA